MDFYELQEVYFLLYGPVIAITLGLVTVLNMAFLILFLFFDAMGLNVYGR